MNNQKGNLYLIIAITVGVFAIGVIGFTGWKYFGGGSELEKEKFQPSYLFEEETIPQVKEQEETKEEEIIPSKKSDEMADWKTYRNEEYGFEIKYSEDQLLYPPLKIFPIEYNINNHKYLGIKLGEFNSGCSLNIFKIDQSENINPFDESDVSIKMRNYVINKKLEFDNIIYYFGMSVASHAVDSEICKSLLNQILSTFKFINPVADYFENAELQYETEMQKQEIFTALNDILNLSEEQLKQKRYKDYTDKENQWDLPTLIYRHFIPEYPGVTLGNNFFRNVKLKEAQKQIKQILEKYF